MTSEDAGQIGVLAGLYDMSKNKYTNGYGGMWQLRVNASQWQLVEWTYDYYGTSTREELVSVRIQVQTAKNSL